MRNLLNRDKNLLGCVCNNTEKHPPVKATFVGCSSKEKQLFSTSTCLLSISVGSQAHEGQKFLATIKLINRNFKACDIFIADTIHKYTLKLTYPEKDISMLHDLARRDGNSWLQRNKQTYEQLTIPYKITRCDEYLQHSLFQEKLDEINKLYDVDQTYRNIFKSNIEQYLIRHKKREQIFKISDALAFSYCLQYLKEECAIFYLLAEKQYNYEIYPSQRCIAMAATYERLIKPFYPNFLKPIELKFKTKIRRTMQQEDVACQLQV